MSVLKEDYNISILDFYILKNIFDIKCTSTESFFLLFFLVLTVAIYNTILLLYSLLER
jgi:hypothetical protein